jgi:DNA repair exonuclease SbcCD ATPase subunit
VKLAESEDHLQTALEAQKLIQDVAQTVQQRAHEQIARIVTRCLQAVFGKTYEFKIVFEQKRGKTEAKMVLLRDGKERNPRRASGGSVADIASWALRLACMVFSRPRKRLLMVLDEPFKNLSRINRERVRTMLETISQEMGVQIIMVTHEDELIAGKVIKL